MHLITFVSFKTITRLVFFLLQVIDRRLRIFPRHSLLIHLLKNCTNMMQQELFCPCLKNASDNFSNKSCYALHAFLTLCSLETPKRVIGKQCRPRLDTA